MSAAAIEIQTGNSSPHAVALYMCHMRSPHAVALYMCHEFVDGSMKLHELIRLGNNLRLPSFTPSLHGKPLPNSRQCAEHAVQTK